MKLAFFLSALIAFSTQSFAATASLNQSTLPQSSISTQDANKPEGFVPFVGGGIGYMNDQLQAEGNPFQVKFIGSYYMPNSAWIFDGGMGLITQSFRNYKNTSSNISALMMEAAARKQFKDRWQAGPIWNVFTRMGERYGSLDNEVHFLGVQAIKETVVMDNNILRLGGRLMTDINAQEGIVSFAMLEAAIGFGGETKRSAPVAQESLKLEGVKMVPADEPVRVVIKEVGSKFNFELDKYKLDKGSETYLQKLSKALAKNPGLVQKIEVVGHADQTGTEQHNLKLSQKRAESTASYLARQGLQVQTAWKGERQPLIAELTPTALKQNRRVELKIYSKNNEAVQKIVKSIQ